MSSENISNWKYQNTQRSRDMLAEYLAGTKGIADAGAVAHLIADNERRGYLNHAAKIGATFGSVADVLAMQLDGSTPIEDDGPGLTFGRAPDSGFETIPDAISGAFGDLTNTIEEIMTSKAPASSTYDSYNIVDAIMLSGSGIADAIREHAASIDRLASAVEKATDRPIRVETQY
jgi:hypothetical protein